MMPRYDMIVIGASTGGIEALKQIISLLPEELSIPVFITVHLYPYSKSYLPDILNHVSHLHALSPKDREPIKQAHIYIAPPNRHMLIEDGYIRLDDGPKENHSRPAINPLFRSAAHWYGAGVIGVVLTGMLDDGTAGLAAIKAYGGLAIVQDPDEALAASMPLSAIKHVAVDYVVTISEIAALLVRLTSEDKKSIVPPLRGE